MKKLSYMFFFLTFLLSFELKGNRVPGFFDFEWQEKEGKIWLYVDQVNQEFLYVNSLAAGVGSNDLGLDRGQLGSTRVVKFVRSGNKLLLKQMNYRYRAVSDNDLERRSVEEAFAQSILWGFTIVDEGTTGTLKVDLTPFLLRDAHGVSTRLANSGQGNYQLDKSRSAIYLERTKNFPKNSEFESILTFTGIPKGGLIRSVVPDPSAVTVRQHHSFIQLPDDGYRPRRFDARSGFNSLSFYDYATPIHEPLVKRWITRHRLQKKNPQARRSEAVEPIVYYLDPGCPEPVKSALLEGARWWNQAFEAAGYIDAFQVKVLPANADPLDVRYNVIQWVHRSTRGWSYGTSVVDPRTGEIIKGHVSLGSLRVRQDFLIAQGLAAPYGKDQDNHNLMSELALTRLRQLSAHEVGHTLGLAHNFAASYNQRASVMDYPHPMVTLDQSEQFDFSQAYDTGIGEWDKRTILYGYQDFQDKANEDQELTSILTENKKMGLLYISDRDARPASGAHPYGHLWDNGSSPVSELKRIIAVRKKALSSFGLDNIRNNQPLALLENILVPVYLAHRYQVDACSKMIGGVHYEYAVKEEDSPKTDIVSLDLQQQALQAILTTLEPSFLEIPEHIIEYLHPIPSGYQRDRELFKIYTGITFDPLGAAESSAQHSLSFLLNGSRLTRIIEQNARNSEHWSLREYLDRIGEHTGQFIHEPGLYGQIGKIVDKLYIHHLLNLAGDSQIFAQVRAEALNYLLDRKQDIESNRTPHNVYIAFQIDQFLKDPSGYKVPPAKSLPDGSPIGCDGGE